MINILFLRCLHKSESTGVEVVHGSDPDIRLMTVCYVGYVADANSAVTTGTLLFPDVPGPRVDLKIKESKLKEG